MPSGDATDAYENWDDYLDSLNKQAPTGVNHAFQYSNLWKRVFTEVAAINGVAIGLCVSASFAFVGLWLFTGNIIVALLGGICLLFNVFYILAFYWIAGWTLGIIEAVRLRRNF